MVVISYGAIRDFIEKHPNTEDALNNRYVITEKSDWANYREVKAIFNAVDAVDNDLYIFKY